MAQGGRHEHGMWAALERVSARSPDDGMRGQQPQPRCRTVPLYCAVPHTLLRFVGRICRRRDTRACRAPRAAGPPLLMAATRGLVAQQALCCPNWSTNKKHGLWLSPAVSPPLLRRVRLQ